ncbi:MAG: TatD family hydrolase [Bacteroidota bacterium]
MIFADSHVHLYAPEYDADREAVIDRSISAGVEILMLPDIDSSCRTSMLELAKAHPGSCFPMLGIHPTSVKENYKDELKLLDCSIEQEKVFAIGECGIDLYWDKTFEAQQEIVFRHQADMALKYDLPLVVHSRKSLNELIRILKDYKNSPLKGVFHCFPGNAPEALLLAAMGFYIGIGGVLTFKNSGLQEVVKQLPPEHIVLETDGPYLAPTPHRGKRNESSFIPLIAEKIAELKNIPIADIADVTTQNVRKLFKV